MKTHQNFPTTSKIRQLPVQVSMNVPPEWEDRNGHVNVQYYQTLYELGGYQILEEVDCGESFLDAHHFGLFDLEHHLNYRSEILVGDRVSTYNRMLDTNERRFHGMYFVVNDSRDALACTLEYMTAGVDLQTRRTAPFPHELLQGVRLLTEKHRLLDWAAPACGTMGV